MILLKNPHTGETRRVPEGFSWTTLFFGFFPALLRGDWIGVVFHVAACVLTFGLAALLLPFFYNRMYARRLRERGFCAPGEQGGLGLNNCKL